MNTHNSLADQIRPHRTAYDDANQHYIYCQKVHFATPSALSLKLLQAAKAQKLQKLDRLSLELIAATDDYEDFAC